MVEIQRSINMLEFSFRGSGPGLVSKLATSDSADFSLSFTHPSIGSQIFMVRAPRNDVFVAEALLFRHRVSVFYAEADGLFGSELFFHLPHLAKEY